MGANLIIISRESLAGWEVASCNVSFITPEIVGSCKRAIGWVGSCMLGAFASCGSKRDSPSPQLGLTMLNPAFCEVWTP